MFLFFLVTAVVVVVVVVAVVVVIVVDYTISVAAQSLTKRETNHIYQRNKFINSEIKKLIGIKYILVL